MPSLKPNSPEVFVGIKKIISLFLSAFIFLWTLLPLAYAQDTQLILEEGFHEHSNDQTDESEEEIVIDYSENFFDVTDQGVVDSSGNVFDFSEKDQDVNQPSETQDFNDERAGLIDVWSKEQTDAQLKFNEAQDIISDKQSRSEELKRELEELEEAMTPLNERALTLEDQIESLNAQMRYNQKRISAVEAMIAEKEVATINVLQDINEARIQRDIQADIVKDYIGLLYEKEASLNDLYSQSTSTVKLVFTDLSRNLVEKDYLMAMEKAGRDVFYELNEQNLLLEEKRADLNSDQIDLNELLQILNDEKDQLKDVQQSKAILLDETRGEQERYQMLLEKNLQQQLQASASVASFRRNIQVIQQKLHLLNNGLDGVRQSEDNSELQEAIDILTVLGDKNGILGKPDLPSSDKLIFPLDREPWITAYFHDKNYPFGVHNALDLRAASGTNVLAAYRGYVFEINPPTNLSYSYILIVHPEGAPASATTYGHMSKVYVKSGDIVQQGDVIGLSGGSPGSKGAGAMTTGAHLHFETFGKDGNYIDPLSVLPLDNFPLEQIPEKYRTDSRERVVRED